MIPGGRNRVSRAVAMPQPWSELDDPTAEDMLCHGDCNLGDYNFCHGDCHAGGEFSVLNALHHYLPSNDSDTDIFDREADIPVDPYSCDEFRMYVFKIRRCARGRTHDWTDCPYAHPGEKARRRDPRKFMYSGTACPDYRKGSCKKGDTCEFAHGVFECWLHPDRYRTQACKDGTNCRRRVCFFAHTPEQLRVLNPHSPRHVAESPPSYDGSPLRQAMDSLYSKGVINSGLYTPPDSPPSDSPPMSPPCARGQSLSRSLCSPSVNEMVASLRNLQLNRMKSVSLPVYRPMVQLNPGFMSPRAAPSLRPAFSSLPTTPTQLRSRSGMVRPNFWDLADAEEELEPVMDRVESGKALRAQIYEKLSKANSLDRDCGNSGGGGPDVDWVSDIIK